MNLNSPRGTLAAGSIALVLMAVLSWFFLIGPVTGDLSEVQTETETAASDNQSLRVQLDRLNEARDQMPTTQAIADDLSKVFPVTADQPGFFLQVNEAARAAGISPGQITDLSPDAPAAELDGDIESADDLIEALEDVEIAVQTVSLSVECNAEQAQAMLAELESMDRGFLVRDVAFSGGQEGTLTITGLTYVVPPLEAPDLDGSDDEDDQDAEAEAAG